VIKCAKEELEYQLKKVCFLESQASEEVLIDLWLKKDFKTEDEMQEKENKIWD